MIKKVLRIIVPKTIRKMFKNFKILAIDYGQYKSIKYCNGIDKNNNTIPWFTYPVIEYLNNLDFSNKSIFEYGSGGSSNYWSKRAKDVISIEHKKEWFDKVKTTLNDNQQLIYCRPDEEYENSISLNNKKYDVIIIDGTRKLQCSKIIDNNLNKESEDGYMIILDNSDWHKETSKYIREKLNLIEVDFHGFSPINNFTGTTSIFFSRNFRFKPIGDTQPSFSLAAVKHNFDQH